MKNWFLLLSLLAGGCSTSAILQGTQKAPAVSAEMREGVLQPQRSIQTLLIERLSLCNDPPVDLETYLNQVIGRPTVVDDVVSVDEEKLDALLLASCKPARTPGMLNQLLADLTASGTWPEEYAAFFDLLIAGQRAYASVEKIYLDLKSEHEKTIQGLSEIEAQIELQTVNSIP
jgi:hypothetical protein